MALAWPPITVGLQTSADGGYSWRHVQGRLEPVALHLACAVIPAGQQIAFIENANADHPVSRGLLCEPACRCRNCRQLAGDAPVRLICPLHRQDRCARRRLSVRHIAFPCQARHDLGYVHAVASWSVFSGSTMPCLGVAAGITAG